MNFFAYNNDFIMSDVINRLTISVIVFTFGVAIGVFYTPEIISLSKSVVDVNLDKQQQEIKSSPLKIKKNKKNRFA
jgi:hypothetical protein